ncbi:hypothetical protein A4G20_05290 [Pasteurellaceae bacterium RH1A]|nr:hypothetical protein A4G20_05290 [Pasteurellaceae bacterium RH1A]
MNKRLFLFLPVLVILIFAGFLGLGLYQAQQTDDQGLIGKPIPDFYLKDLHNLQTQRSLQDLPKEAFVLNVWASWCTYCRQEFPLLHKLAGQGIKVVGINFADQRQAALNTLESLGNPYLFSLQDTRELTLQLGGNQAPQTFLVDKHGVIRAYHLGLMRELEWQRDFLPVLQQLK